MAVSKQPTITPETSSGEGLDEEPSSRGEAKWKRFHPFRVVRKIFRRRVKRDGTAEVSDASKKSWSTSELQSVQEVNSGKCEVTSPLKIGLSVSHDSIFSPEGNTSVNSEELNVPRGSSLSVCPPSVKNMFKDELFSRVRARRDSEDEDDDVGLPHSPCTSPTTVDILTQGLKEKTFKLQTTCSAGSLISMESSENDEDSAGLSSGHSSRMSLLDKRSVESEGDPDLYQHIPLNHNAAHHRIAIRPKRTYGLPRRRMNQLAASKKSTLPSTPEVFEESAKVFQFSESNITEKNSISHQSTEQFSVQTQLLTFDHAELLTSMHETQIMQKEYQVSISEDAKTHEIGTVISESKMIQKSNINDAKLELLSSNSIKDIITDTMTSGNKLLDNDTTSKSANSMDDYKLGVLSRSSESEMESIRLVKNSLQDIIRSEIVVKEDPLSQRETPLKVSSLVKNIEHSDSLKSSETVSKIQESQSRQYSGDKILIGENNTEKMATSAVELKQSVTGEISSRTAAFASLEEQRRTSKEFISEVVKKSTSITEKLDTESEFVFKPVVKKDTKIERNFENLMKEKVSEKSNDHTILSSSYPEEESIMSDKSLSLGIEENRVFVSHQVSYSDKLTDMLVTETHNVGTMNEKLSMSVQTSQEKTMENKKVSDPWISSVSNSTSKTAVTDVTVNSLTSNFCDKNMLEDRVTISVNAISENSNKKISDVKREENVVITPKHIKSSAPSKPVSNPRSGHKEKSQPKYTHGSHLPDVVSSNSKNINTPKRVSVEIVPFNQRMKERKYQPLVYSNRETSPDPVKKNNSMERKCSGKEDSIKKHPNTSIERKLSDSKVTTKSKESEKSSNRHSFSGSVTPNAVKKEFESSTEKVQYPVQIRVHKSSPKTESKEKIDSKNLKDVKRVSNNETNDIKFQMQYAKTDIKYIKEQGKDMQENSAKWEVKIQPVAQTPASKLSHPNLKEKEENSTTSQNSLKRSSDLRSPQPMNDGTKVIENKEIESPPIKNRENNWKSPKETPPPTTITTTTSDDPEPELLRVFARRSIKQKHCDKGKPGDKKEKTAADLSSDESLPFETTETYNAESCNQMISVSQNSTVIKISETPKPHISKPDLIKKKSKSFSEKEKIIPRSASPLKEMNLIRRESPTKLINSDSPYNETVHPRQRLASVPDLPITLPPELEKRNSLRGSVNGSAENTPTPSLKEEHIHRASSISVPSPTSTMNGSMGTVKDSQEFLNGKEPHTPAWLQLAQQRRELREQRERLLLGSSTNSFLDPSSKPSRSSKVWDMVNNFQKLQMT